MKLVKKDGDICTEADELVAVMCRAYDRHDEYADAIVHAVNSHKNLLDALKVAFRYGQFEDAGQLKMIGDAIAKAEGE